MNLVDWDQAIYNLANTEFFKPTSHDNELLMHRLAVIFALYIFFASYVAGAVAHVAEPVGCIDAPTAAAFGHTDGDADQGTDSNDKTTSHHHGGCNGHHVSVTPEAHAPVFYFPPKTLFSPCRTAGSPCWARVPISRPPIA